VEQGARGKEHGAKSMKQRARGKEHKAWSKEQENGRD